MVSSNKILTVSYGTFSCTLEGFDNSFDTMKAIAEYFRDLAQDDRYFGAEPPTPDAEMLARIAEREIARRVEARFEKGNLVLRPKDDAEPPHGDVAPEPTSGAALAGVQTGVAATALAVAEAQETDDIRTGGSGENDIGESNDILTDEIALDLSDIDAAEVSQPDDETPLTIADDPSEDLHLDVLPDEDETAYVADEEDTVEVEVFEEEVEDAAELVEPVPPAPADSVADKLQRIRAVVANKAEPQPEYTEDEHAMSGSDGDGVDENDALEATATIPGFDTEAETDEAEDTVETAEVAEEVEDTVEADELTAADDNLFTDTIAALISDQIDTEDDDEEESLLPTLSDEEDEFAADPQSEIDALRARIAELESKAADAPAPVQPTLVEDMDDMDDDLAEADDQDDPDADEASQDEDTPDAAAPLVARVSKAKRSDVEAAIAAGAIEEYDEDDEDDDDAVAVQTKDSGKGDLTAEEEAELARELAELQAEIDEDEDWNFEIPEDSDAKAQDDDDVDSLVAAMKANEETSETDAQANIRKAVKLTSPARAMLTDSPIEEDDDSVERLIDQAETELDEPEGNRRRSAIAHLRAAVAATKADRLLGLGKKKTNEEDVYREDLADAVRPRRPKVTQARSERPAPVRPAPLKLVAEQRVDVATEDMTPVRPRRVMRSVDPVEAQDEAMSGDDTGFAEFAEKAGAHTLPELLEAAASYMSFVEGRDQFSRPQLMTKLHQTEGAASSREERLRSFGQLLREGKIEKTGGGRFTASDSIGFKPSARAAG